MRRRSSVLAVALVAVVAAACSSDNKVSSQSAGSTTTRSSSTPTAATEPVFEPCTSSSIASSGGEAPPVNSGQIPQLSLTDVAKLDRGPTSVATRCQEDALYVTLQGGTVVRVDLSAPADTAATKVLDITSRVHNGGEQGLLGLAFSPDGSQLYLAYTNTDDDQQLDRFTVGTDGIDPDSRQTVLTIKDFAPNHNGGQLLFGIDGYLYWGMGDGGGANDSTEHTGQNPNDLLASILRLDVLHPANGKQYGIPADNPFASGGGAPEVFAYGLRNPWRFTFDPANNDLWIADVGQGHWEEIDHVTFAEAFGANFGWSSMEGTDLLNGATKPVGIQPVHEYDHSKGACAVIGGYVYRGRKIPALDGVYFYGDNCVPNIEGLRLDDQGKAVPVDVGLGVGGLSTFAQDLDGELYAVSLDGTVVRIDGA